MTRYIKTTGEISICVLFAMALAFVGHAINKKITDGENKFTIFSVEK